MKALWRHFQRQRALNRCPEVVRNWLQSWPDPDQPALLAPLLALDFETTGLDPAKDAILSAGWVPMDQGVILAGRGEHRLVRIEQPLPEETIKVHGITHQRMATGQTLEQLLTELFSALHGRLPLVHFARIEQRFLAAACRKLFGCAPPLPMVDTFELARRTQERSGRPPSGDTLRLDALRQAHGLPDRPPHHALEDALATAELWLAMLKQRSDGTRLKLKEVLV